MCPGGRRHTVLRLPRASRTAALALAATGVLLLLLVLALALVISRTRATPAAAPLSHGEIALLRGTPHYFVADERGVLHWASDTRALAGRYVRWERVRLVTLDQLRALPRGEPWLTAPGTFVRGEDGAVYLIRWETGMRWPVPLRLPPIENLELLGITRQLVESLATDQRTWERLMDLSLEATAVSFSPLTPGPAATGPGAGWNAATYRGTGTQAFPTETYEVVFTLSPPRLDPSLGVIAGTVNYPSFPCGGPVGLLSIDAERLELTERFTSGLERCTDQGRVTLERRSDRRVFYVWVLPAGRMSVSGFLFMDN